MNSISKKKKRHIILRLNNNFELLYIRIYENGLITYNGFFNGETIAELVATISKNDIEVIYSNFRTLSQKYQDQIIHSMFDDFSIYLGISNEDVELFKLPDNYMSLGNNMDAQPELKEILEIIKPYEYINKFR